MNTLFIKTRDLIVNMVNLLPVAVNSTVDLSGLVAVHTNSVRTVLQGHPADKNKRPVQIDYLISEKMNTELLPYSFTIISISIK
jgi:hypothetical protein